MDFDTNLEWTQTANFFATNRIRPILQGVSRHMASAFFEFGKILEVVAEQSDSGSFDPSLENPERNASARAALSKTARAKFISRCGTH